jgi:hypothetical protein
MNPRTAECLLCGTKGLIYGSLPFTPHGIDKPSLTDFEELTFPGIIYLIWYTQGTTWHCRGYLMNSEQKPIEVPVIIST